MRRVVLWIALVVTALLLQSVVFARFELGGAKPELIFLLTVVVASLEGPASGALAGFFGGLAEDFLLNQPKGITALTLTLLGYTVGLARQYIVSPSPLLPTILVALGTFGGVVFYEIVSFLLGQLDDPLLFLLRVALLSALYSAVLTPLVYPVLRRIFERSRPRRVVRF